jgi:hypothetical protein
VQDTIFVAPLSVNIPVLNAGSSNNGILIRDTLAYVYKEMEHYIDICHVTGCVMPLSIEAIAVEQWQL